MQDGRTHEASCASRSVIVPEVDVRLQDSNTIDTTPVAQHSDKDIPGRERTNDARGRDDRAEHDAGKSLSESGTGCRRRGERRRRRIHRTSNAGLGAPEAVSPARAASESHLYTYIRGEIWSGHVPGLRALSPGER